MFKQIKTITLITLITLIALAILIVLIAINYSTGGSLFSGVNNTLKDSTDAKLALVSMENNNILLTFSSPIGLKTIECPNSTKIECNGRTKVAIDYQVEANQKYTFEITDNNNKRTSKTVNCPQSHIEIARQNFDIDMEATMERLTQNFYDNLIATNFITMNMGELNYMNSAQAINLQEAVSTWRTIGASTWRVTSDGKIYSSVPGGQTKPNWWGTGLINPDEKIKQTYSFEMDFTLAQSGQLNEGPCFFVTVNPDNTLSGYFFNVNNHKACYGNPNYYKCCLWKFNHYNLDQSFSAGINDSTHMWCYPVSTGWNVGGTSSYGNNSFTCLAAWNGSLNAQYHVEASDGHILITMNGNTVANVNDSTYTSGTYGFWGNNCEQKDSMYLTNISFKSMNIYTLANLIRDTNWVPTTNNIVVNFSNMAETSISDQSVIDLFVYNDIHYVSIGNEDNKEATETFISNINNNGQWINSSDYETYMTSVENYLVDLLCH